MPEYRRGTGPNALPQGAASALTEATPNPGLDDDIPIQFTTKADLDDDEVGAVGDDMAALLDAPDPNYKPALMRGGRPGRVPQYVVRHLPALLAAAADPGAPPSLIALKNSIIRHLEDEMRRGG